MICCRHRKKCVCGTVPWCLLQIFQINWVFILHQAQVGINLHLVPSLVVRDSSAVWRLLWNCCSRGRSERYTYGKQLIWLSSSWSAHFHVSWLSDFIFYHKPLYKALHQSFFYSFITILPSVVLHSITARFCLGSYYSAIWLPFSNLQTWSRDTNWMMTVTHCMMYRIEFSQCTYKHIFARTGRCTHF